jgi:hypothetical protein
VRNERRALQKKRMRNDGLFGSNGLTKKVGAEKPSK